MDLSSLPEEQRQQLQQLQQQFQEHQLQQQQQQQQQQQIQDYAPQAYDPGQVQAYDQSYYAYYQYQDSQQSQQYSQSQVQHQQQQQNYAYYQADYANTYQQQPQQQQEQQQHQQQHSQPEPAPSNPSGISVSGEPQPQIAGESGGAAATAAGSGQVQGQHQQNAYYPQQGGPTGDQQNPGYPLPSGLNPAAAAAVAALSQLAQFAGTMEAAEKAIAMVGMQARGGGYGPMIGQGPGLGPFMGPVQMHHGPLPYGALVGHSPYRGGRRGGRPFRGNGPGNFGNRPPRSGGTGPPFHGRGRGRGRGGRRFPPNGASSSHPKSSSNEEAEGSDEEAEPTADNQEEPEATQTSALEQGKAAPNKRPPQAAWCELCRVDCTSFEILEQHKNGKKHKKNLQKLEESQRANNAISGVQHGPAIVQEGEDKHILQENLNTESVDNENREGTVQKNDEAEHPEIPVAEQSNAEGMKPWVNRSGDLRRGMKRKMRGGRGGKRMKTVDAPKQPPRPKVVIPLICDLCNVKCDTQEVFNRHLSGKKHISKLKRFEGHQAMYGPSGLQALYPPNPIAQTLLPQGPQQTFCDPQGSYPHPESSMSQAHHSAQSTTVSGSEFPQNPNYQVSGSTSCIPEVQQQTAFVAPETKQNDVTAQTYA